MDGVEGKTTVVVKGQADANRENTRTPPEQGAGVARATMREALRTSLATTTKRC